MNNLYRQLLVFLILFSCPLKSAPGGAVATVDPIATDAAIHALKNGGNAFDAAVAAGLTLGVVNGYNSGIGGGCFVVILELDIIILLID